MLEPAQYLALKYINALPSLLDFENLSVNSSSHETEDEIITKHYAQYFQQRKDSGISAIFSGHSTSTDSASIYSRPSESIPILNQGSQQQVKFILSEQNFDKASREGQRKTNLILSKRQLGQLPHERQATKLIPSKSQPSKLPAHIITDSDLICSLGRRQKNGTGTFNKGLENSWSVTATDTDNNFSSGWRRQSQTAIQDERLESLPNIPERSFGCIYNPKRRQRSKTTILDERLDSSWDISLRDADPAFNQQTQRLFKAIQQQEVRNKIAILDGHLETVLDRVAMSDSTLNQERKGQVNTIIEKREEETKSMILDNHLAKVFGTQATIEEPDYRQKSGQVQKEKSACQRSDSTKSARRW